MEPKPRRCGTVTGGPPRSSQHNVNSGADRPFARKSQPMAMHPDSFDSVPYFAALVASSCNAIPIAWDAAGEMDRGGPKRYAPADQISEMEKLRADEIIERQYRPFVLDQEVLRGRERPDALAEALNEVLRTG